MLVPQPPPSQKEPSAQICHPAYSARSTFTWINAGLAPQFIVHSARAGGVGPCPSSGTNPWDLDHGNDPGCKISKLYYFCGGREPSFLKTDRQAPSPSRSTVANGRGSESLIIQSPCGVLAPLLGPSQSPSKYK